MSTALQNPVIERIEQMLAALEASPSNLTQGDFWKALSRKHIDLIQRFGFEHFKRTVNFEYGQWGVSSLRDAKIWQLLKLFFREHRVPAGLLGTRISFADAGNVRWPDSIDPSSGEAVAQTRTSRRRTLVYAFYVSLLWQYARLTDRIGFLKKCSEPMFGAPVPVYCNGRLISQDLALSCIETNFLCSSLDMSRVQRILEIGAGYGRLAYALSTMLPGVEYCIADIPPALAISERYLARTLGESRVAPFSPARPRIGERPITAVLPHQLREYPDEYFDLVINISSFDEMTPSEVNAYFDIIDRKCGNWLYVQGYEFSRSGGTRLGVSEFPYRSRWTALKQRKHPTIPSFIERIYELRSRVSPPTISAPRGASWLTPRFFSY